ncbi:MAG TPA: SEC-C metal-binding domain-containing protein [Hyphomicrobiaceae bacterium]
MTLILTLGCSDYIVQASDRRLVADGHLVDDESNKSGVLECMNARLAFGFTGLAKFGSFDTRRWLLDALHDAGPPDYAAKGIIDRLADKASRAFAIAPLNGIPSQHKRLSIMFSGYLYHHSPPRMGYAIVTNYQDFIAGIERPGAKEQFHVQYWQERRPLDDDVTLVQRIGTWRAMTREDEVQLRALLKARRPARALTGKAVDVMQSMADRASANGAIGKQISTIQLPVSRGEPVQSGYYTRKLGYVSYMADYVIATSNENRTVMRDMEIRQLRGDTPIAVAVPKVGRNVPCPCGSGRKYKFCHGHPRLLN